MKYRFVIGIRKTSTSIIARVLSMDDELRDCGEVSCIEGSDMTIRSSSYPEIGSSCFFLRGARREHDNDVVKRDFDSAQEIERYAENLEKLAFAGDGLIVPLLDVRMEGT